MNDAWPRLRRRLGRRIFTTSPPGARRLSRRCAPVNDDQSRSPAPRKMRELQRLCRGGPALLPLLRGPQHAAAARRLELARPCPVEGARTSSRPTPRRQARPGTAPQQGGAAGFMPTPQAAAVAVMALLAFGVIVGSLTQQFAQSAGVTTRPAGQADLGAGTGRRARRRSRSGGNRPRRARTRRGGSAAARSAGEAAPEEEAAPVAAPAPDAGTPARTDPAADQPRLPDRARRPGLRKHLRGRTRRPPTSRRRCPNRGSSCPTTTPSRPGDLSNEIALLSGQGPTAADGRELSRIRATSSPSAPGLTEQVEGAGCVYPAETQTLPGQLVAAKLSWKAYVEDIGSGEAGQPTTCRRPILGAADPTLCRAPATAMRPGATRSSTSTRSSTAKNAPNATSASTGLGADLANVKRTPTLSYIVPDACHDGSEVPCEPGQPAGLAGDRIVPADGRTGNPEIPGLRRRGADRDHLCAGAAGRARSRSQLVLRDTRIPEPESARELRPRNRSTARSNRAVAAAGSGCC